MFAMKLHHIERGQLSAYVQTQIRQMFPLPGEPNLGVIDACLDAALQRLGCCIDQVRLWRPGEFDVLHSTQYAIFLYYLSNTIWRAEGPGAACTQLFLLNKALNGIDCFYEIDLPEVFFIGHTVGIVLAKASYGNHLVLYQSSTVGKNHGAAPVIEDGVILYPHTAVIGNCRIGARSVIAQGVSVVSQDIPKGHMVFPGSGRELIMKPLQRPLLSDFFRDV